MGSAIPRPAFSKLAFNLSRRYFRRYFLFFFGDMTEHYKQFWQKGKTFYFISKYGIVLSTTDTGSSHATWHLIATYNGKGYRRVRLQGKTFKVHRLVAEAFIPNPFRLPNVLHKDGNRENNHYTNLEWSDRQSNHHFVNL